MILFEALVAALTIAFWASSAMLSVCVCACTWPLVRPCAGVSGYWRFVDLVATRYWALLARWAECWANFSYVYYGDDVPAGESALLVSNHVWLGDWLTLFGFAARKGRLGSQRHFAKQMVRWIPGFGYGIAFLGSVFLSRTWTRDRASIERTFETLRARRRPVWLISWVEGTRCSADKIAESQAFARSRHMAELRHCLTPRTKGFVATVQALRGDVVDYVYDVTVAYEPRARRGGGGVGAPPPAESAHELPSIIDIVMGRQNQCVHFYVRRFDIDALPSTDNELADWLQQRFVEKDALLQHFAEHRRFPGTSRTSPFQCLPVLPRQLKVD
jgi:1-acyl-sn-glycerol-3-phosphate acyltransferase